LKAFDNKPLLGRSLLLLAKLSQKEAQYDEAINLCHAAQVRNIVIAYELGFQPGLWLGSIISRIVRCGGLTC